MGKVEFKEASSNDIRICDSKYYSMYLNIAYQTQACETALIQRRYNVMII